jgi:cation:H+ antiporter
VRWWLAGALTRGFLPRPIGIALLVLLAVYMYLSVRWARQHPQLIPAEAAAEVDTRHPVRAAVISLAVLVFGLALVVAGSELLIGSVKEICTRYKVPEEVLAVTLVAFGTSLPELVTALAAIAKGHRDLLVGNVIGADILNVLFVVGASSAAVQLKVEPSFFRLYLPLIMASIVLLGAYIASGGKTFKRWQGVPLLGLYVLFCILTVKYGGQLGR